MTYWFTRSLDDLRVVDQRQYKYDSLLNDYTELQVEVVELRRRLAEHDRVAPPGADFYGMTGTRRPTFLED